LAGEEEVDVDVEAEVVVVALEPVDAVLDSPLVEAAGEAVVDVDADEDVAVSLLTGSTPVTSVGKPELASPSAP
jgi:enoyl-CoA hydratase/carnithine racemase